MTEPLHPSSDQTSEPCGHHYSWGQRCQGQQTDEVHKWGVAQFGIFTPDGLPRHPWRPLYADQATAAPKGGEERHCRTHVFDHCNALCAKQCYCGHLNGEHDTVGICYACNRRCGESQKKATSHAMCGAGHAYPEPCSECRRRPPCPPKEVNLALRVSFDIGGVITRYPRQVRALMWALIHGGVEVFVLTDMARETAVALLRQNGFPFVGEDHVIGADWNAHEDRCKDVEMRRLRIDVHFDDFAPYCVTSDDTMTLMVWPKPSLPYNAAEWNPAIRSSEEQKA